jgi:hypothetical protein
MPYACPAWKFAAESCLLKLQRLQNKVLSAIGNLPRRKPTEELHAAFNISYVCDFITQLCRQQATVIQTHTNASVRNTGHGKTLHTE